MTELPNGLGQAFTAVAGELGMASAAWLFARAVAKHSGDEGVRELADRTGPDFPVIDAVAKRWLAGERTPKIDARAVLDAVGKATRLVLVGLEAPFVDALIDAAPDELKIATVAHSPFPVDWDRVLDNWRGRVERVDLDDFQHWAGHRSALLTFTYGQHGSRTLVMPLWLRVAGPDVRSQFRALVGWDVLGAPLDVYPRWLVETDTEQLTHVVR